MNPVPRLKVSGKAHELALRVLEHTRSRVWSHDMVLRDQLQRGALAVASRIVCGARDNKERAFPRAVDGALAALREVAYLLLLARDLGLLPSSGYATLEARTGELDRMLVGLRQRLHSSGGAARAPSPFRASSRPREAREVDRPAQPRAPERGAPLGVG